MYKSPPIILAGLLALSVTACGGGGGGGGQASPTPSPTVTTTPPSPPPLLPNTITRVVTGKSLVPVVSVQAPAEEIFKAVGKDDHADGRKQIASTMELGSMTQSSSLGFKVGMDDRGSLIGPNGLFTITSRFDWNSDESIETNPCLCSINVFAGFYDADGYGLMYMGAAHPGNVVTAPGLYSLAKHGFLMGYYYQGVEDFGVFVDATSLTSTLRNFGTARYAIKIAGFMTGLDPSGHIQVDGRTTMTVSWGDRPSLSGKVSTLYGDKVTVDSLGVAVTMYNHYTLTTELVFHGTDWSTSLNSFHNGNIDCASRCEVTNESRSRWGAMLADNGSGGVDPFRLVGTFGLYQYSLDGNLVDWIGFVFGETPFDGYDLNRGFTDESRSPGRALVRQVGVAVSREMSHAESPYALASADTNSIELVIHDAATIDAPYSSSGDVALFVDYSRYSPWVVGTQLGFYDYQVPVPVVGGQSFGHTLISGSASYSGNAGGFYASNDGVGGGFVSTIDLDVEFRGFDSPILRGALGYDFGGISGKLSMSGGTWNGSIMTSFNDGILECASGCQEAGSFARWSAQFIDVTGTGSLLPEGVIGKFGANGIRQQGNDEQVFKMYGIFAAVDEISTPVWPARSSFFPATPNGMLADAAGMHHRKDFKTGRRVDRYFYNTGIGTTVSVVRSGGNFVNPGGTIQLASNFWDWRTDDYANCYCTMFLIGTAYDSDGNEIKGGLSSSPKLRWSSIDYTDAKHGWVGGLWRLDLLPSEWSSFGGRTQLGIFVDGTVPTTLPTRGSASYRGYGTGYAMPSTSTLATDMESMRTWASIGVAWGPGSSPSVTGLISLGGDFTRTTIKTRVSLTMGAAQWSATDKKFHSGSLGCRRNCKTISGTKGSWEGLFVETGDDQPSPGVFAGAFAMSGVSIIAYHQNDGRLSTSIYHGVWDLFGWFDAEPTTRYSFEKELLKMPGRVVHQAVQEGFDVIYANASSAQRRDAVDVAGVSTVWVNASLANVKEYGKLTLILPLGDGTGYHNYSGFWTNNRSNNLSLGLLNTGFKASSLPRTNTAKFTGNAAGFYSSANDSGVMLGDVDLTIEFGYSNAISIEVNGMMDFDFGGETGSFRMQHTIFNTNLVRDGEITCASGCTGGSGKWGGHFVDTEPGRPSGTVPGGFIGSYGLDGIVLDSNGAEYDVLGVFATTHE